MREEAKFRKYFLGAGLVFALMSSCPENRNYRLEQMKNYECSKSRSVKLIQYDERKNEFKENLDSKIIIRNFSDLENFLNGKKD